MKLINQGVPWKEVKTGFQNPEKASPSLEYRGVPLIEVTNIEISATFLKPSIFHFILSLHFWVPSAPHPPPATNSGPGAKNKRPLIASKKRDWQNYLGKEYNMIADIIQDIFKSIFEHI